MIAHHHLDLLHDCPSQLWPPDVEVRENPKPKPIPDPNPNPTLTLSPGTSR